MSFYVLIPFEKEIRHLNDMRVCAAVENRLHTL
jgi:hypothetical protein